MKVSTNLNSFFSMKITFPFLLSLLLTCGSFLRAEETTLLFDFGTEFVKVTASAAGFSQNLTGSGSFNDQPDGLEVAVDAGSGFQNFSFLRTFSGLGGGQATDFTMQTEVRVNDIVGGGHENNDRWGILLFGEPGNDTASDNGISAQVLARANTTTAESQNAEILLRDGLNGSTLSSGTWVSGPITQDDALRLVVVGTLPKCY